MSLASLPSRVSVTAPLGLPEVAADPLNVGIVWDAENRLVAVTQGPTTLASFAYDGMGRRAQKAAAGVTRTYVSDQASVIEERVSTGQTLRYVEGLGIDQHLAMQDGAAVTYYLADHLGSVVQATNGVGAVTLVRKYDPWGNMLAGASAAGWSFTGREWDPEIQAYDYRARYYDPRAGRFMSEDPMGFFAGVNFYAYVLNSPTILTDPMGLWVRVYCEFIDSGGNSSGGRAAAAAVLALHCYVDVNCPGRYHVTLEIYGDNSKHMDPFKPTRNAGAAWITPVKPPGCIGSPEQNSCSNGGDCTYEDSVVRQYQATTPPPYNPTGPNSNTFAANLITKTGGSATFPPNAVGHDYCPGK